MSHQLQSRVEAIVPGILALKRTIHEHPELGLQEYETCKLLETYVKDYVVYERMHRVGKTGLFIEIKGTKPGKGKTLIIRGDIDALPITEDANAPYCSKNQGVMHACGHDVHGSCIVGTARILSDLRDTFAGSVYVFVQPAEEILAGAKLFLDDPEIDFSKVDGAFALHCSPEFEAGKIGTKQGGILASSDTLEIVVTGKGGHGAHPNTVVDPIVVASAIVQNLQTIVSRETDPSDSVVVSLCSIHGGNAFNIVPSEVVLKGTVRTINPASRDAVEASVKRIVHAMAEAYKARATVNYVRGVPPMVNSSDWVDRVFRVGEKVLGKDQVVHLEAPSMGGEDFAFIIEKVGGVFIRLGARTPGGPYGSIHSSGFYCDDRAIPTALTMASSLALDFLGAE
ncbi:amidohydrolase [Sphaerochaeta pleomorpha str. Grapes]|uniref:Amidohydrolase n=1 Tax=Sphaerochaeta pleomorpha (strain ATCC BAA-1885 / DSM 22778 / Grapes) TaxID=158190 RepID=G8QX03_SPHPG|nr:M20 family metallopeptidase [Sphaerochaeta pleomorpha]AEV29507.1 amidohydrolase [Sphaerochaeta pleomorpha str. Grapes]